MDGSCTATVSYETLCAWAVSAFARTVFTQIHAPTERHISISTLNTAMAAVFSLFVMLFPPCKKFSPLYHKIKDDSTFFGNSYIKFMPKRRAAKLCGAPVIIKRPKNCRPPRSRRARPIARKRSLFAAALALGVERQLKESRADFLRIFLRGRDGAIAVGRHEQLHLHRHLQDTGHAGADGKRIV